MKKDIKNKMTKIICKSFYMIMYLLIILILVFIYVNESKSIKTSKYEAVIIVSESMKPEINIGDIIIIKKVESKDIKINDIVTFEKNEQYVTHRIKEIQKEDEKIIYTTKGDNNVVEDIEKVNYAEIKGIKVANIPFIGLFILVISKQKNLIILLIILIFLYKRAKNKDDRKKERIKKKRIEDEKNVPNS